MRFDDRLMTVLEQPASDPLDRAVRWRQLVDLVARSGAQSGSPLVQQALGLIRTDMPSVDQPLRAAAARAVAALPLPADLIALFATDRLVVAAPVLAAARLSHDEWLALLADADEEVRNFVRTLNPDLPAMPAAAEPEPFVEAAPVAPAPWPEAPGDSSRERFERLRRGEPRLRREIAAEEPEPTPPAPASSLFRWECGPSGEIGWVEGAPRGPLIGRTIARAEEGGVGEDVERAFAMRAPFRDAALAFGGDGVLAGQWKISGVPAFDPADGRFAGYRGIALREGEAPGRPSPLQSAIADPDSLRELVHEIKTPLNAIIGFAEIIDSQLLGPADPHYRLRAAEIVAQARLLLAAIDDLDFAAKLQADRGRTGSGTDLAMLLEQIVARAYRDRPHDSAQLDYRVETHRRRCALEPALAERLVTRFLDALAAAAPAGSVTRVHLDNAPGRCQLWSPVTPASAEFGLQLVRGLAQIAGGELTVGGGRITLVLPEL